MNTRAGSHPSCRSGDESSQKQAREGSRDRFSSADGANRDRIHAKAPAEGPPGLDGETSRALRRYSEVAKER